MSSHIPIQVMKTENRAKKISLQLLPNPNQAVLEYCQGGGRITDPDANSAGSDPITDGAKQLIRDHAFKERFPSFDVIFHKIVNYDSDTFKRAVLFYIDLTYRLVHSY